MKRTINNCSLINRMIKSGAGSPEVQEYKCTGYSGNTDEPCEICKKCGFNTYYEDERMV